MKYAICQINTSVGDLKYNYKKIISNYELSLSKGADLVIFPELTITGYPPKDLLLDKAFIDLNLYYSKKFQRNLQNQLFLVSLIEKETRYIIL